jgi:hypothetical protein
MDGYAAGQDTKQRTGRESRRPRPRARALGVAVVMALALTACSGDGSVELPTSLPTGLPTTLPSITLPTVTLPTVTLPTVTLPEATAPEVTAEPPAPEVTAEPTAPEVTAEPPTPEVTPEATEEPTDSATAAPPVAEEEGVDADDAGSGWLWLLLLLVAAGALVGIAMLLRRRRARAAWAEALEEPLQEATWLRDSIVPNLLAQGPDGRAGVWAIGRSRVLTLEQRLGELVAQAPDPAAVRQVGALSAAVQALRRALDHSSTLVGFGGGATTAALQQSQSELDEAIRALQPLSDERAETTPTPNQPAG